jgi:uncharacterized protein (DUF1499 family)
MARRHVHEEPVSQLAIWARRMAFFALAASGLAVIILQSGMLEVKPAIATFGAALAIAGIALLLSLAALAAMAISLLLLGYPGYIAIRAYHLPLIYDITTDPLDPPRYEALARVRPRDANPIAYAGLYSAEQQRRAYPDIGPLTVNATPQATYDAAYAVINKRKWRIVDARAPQARREGHIEAVARTPVMGFRDDVIVRVRTDGDGARIDIRSSSRYGSFDFGANAARIRSLMNEIDDTIAQQRTIRPAPQEPPPKKGAPTAKTDQRKR